MRLCVCRAEWEFVVCTIMNTRHVSLHVCTLPNGSLVCQPHSMYSYIYPPHVYLHVHVCTQRGYSIYTSLYTHMNPLVWPWLKKFPL